MIVVVVVVVSDINIINDAIIYNNKVSFIVLLLFCRCCYYYYYDNFHHCNRYRCNTSRLIYRHPSRLRQTERDVPFDQSLTDNYVALPRVGSTFESQCFRFNLFTPPLCLIILFVFFTII